MVSLAEADYAKDPVEGNFEGKELKFVIDQ